MTHDPSAAPTEAGQAVALALRWGDGAELQTVYANELAILHTANEFYLVFGEVILPPMLVDGQAADGQVEIKPVVRVAVGPRQMLRFAEVIQQNVERFKAHEQEEEDA